MLSITLMGFFCIFRTIDLLAKVPYISKEVWIYKIKSGRDICARTIPPNRETVNKKQKVGRHKLQKG